MRKWNTLAIEIIISLILVFVVLQLADMQKVLAALAKVDLKFIALAFVAYFSINVCMAYRIQIILVQMKEKIKFSKVLMANFVGMLVSDFTPARSGYFATAFAMTANEKIPLEKSIASILAPQMFDFMVKVFGGTVAIAYISWKLNLGIGSLLGMVGGLVAIVLMLTFGMLLLFSPKFMRILKFVEKLPFGKNAYGFISDMQEHAIQIKPLFPIILLLLAFTWSLKGLEWWMLSLALGINLPIDFPPFFFFLFLQPLITMLQFVPTPTLAGMGLSEAGAAVVLGLFGIPAEQGVAFGLLTRSLMIAMDLVGINEARRVVRKNLDKII